MKGYFSIFVFIGLLFVHAESNIIKIFDSFPAGRIVGGNDAKPHSAPYIVSLQLGTSHFCGGSIIDEETIVTTAHCALTYPCETINIVAGLHNVKDITDPKVQILKVKKCIIHPDYDVNGSNDIAIIKLQKSIILVDKVVESVVLPRKNSTPKDDATLYGWGSTSTTAWPNMPQILQTATVKVEKLKNCKKALEEAEESYPFDDNKLCTGLTGNISACSGDSGSPLVQKGNKGKFKLVGIFSWGKVPCGSENSPSVYIRVSAYKPFINKHKKN